MPATQKMPCRFKCNQALLPFILATALFSLTCAAAKEPASGDSATPATTPTPQSAQASPPSSPEAKKPAEAKPPTLNEVQAVVKRVCEDTVTIETSRSAPFINGDFNGDGSQDIAIIVKPSKGALPKLNSEYANWIVEDPQKVPPPGQKSVSAPVRIQQDDLLLLILHGYKQEGWRHQLARQTFLLRNVVGEDIRVQSLNEASKMVGGKSAMPPLPGDVIREKLAGQDGFLYWTNVKYAWHQ